MISGVQAQSWQGKVDGKSLHVGAKKKVERTVSRERKEKARKAENVINDYCLLPQPRCILPFPFRAKVNFIVREGVRSFEEWEFGS